MDILTLQKWAYIDGAPSYNATAYGLLNHYSGIPEADIDSHLLHIVGVFREPVYPLFPTNI